MNTIFDITAFGAVGDGSTDCTAAIQSALDAAAQVNGCVTVPPGIFCTGPLTMPAHTRFEGKSAWSFRSDGLSVLRLNDPSAPWLLNITGAFGSTLAGLSLDGAGLGENIHGVYLHWPVYNGGSEEDTPAIDDCRIGNFTGDGVHLSHIWCFSVRHSMLHRNRGAGLYIDGWDGFILDNWFTANGRGGILGGPWVASITATGNRVEWNRAGGFLFGGGDSANFTGNFFDRSFGPAIRLGNGEAAFRDAAITGNVFRRSGCPDGMTFPTPYENSHVYLVRAENITLTGNTMKTGVNDGGGGTKSPDYGVVVTQSDRIIVQANAMFGGANLRGLFWDGSGQCLLDGNCE